MGKSHYDLIVIGSGPAGEKAAAQAAYFDKKVALIESADSLGGAAVNTGTLPSKTLREAALHLSGLRQRGFFPFDPESTHEICLDDLVFRQQIVRDSERARIMINLENHHVDRFRGTGSFLDPHTIQVKDQGEAVSFTGDVILIATGSRPNQPDIFPFSDPHVYDSDSILKMKEIPKSMAIVGAGVIGIEYACVFSSLGVNVTLIHGQDSFLPFMDQEIIGLLRASMEAMGIRMKLNQRVNQFRKSGGILKLQLDSNNIVEVDSVLITAGRRSNVEALHLDNAGISTGERGLIPVSECGQTQVGHIYAAGDVVGFPALASTSMEQGRIAVTHAFQLGYKEHLSPILPFGIYAIPECSMAGATEEKLKQDGIPYVTGRARYSNNARGTIVGDDLGRLKLLFHQESGKLLGVHVIGEQATEIIHVGLTALIMEADLKLFIRTCYNYPTLSEMYKYAAYDALGKMPETTKHLPVD
jgi:NAD(P) transhydrogenase